MEHVLMSGSIVLPFQPFWLPFGPGRTLDDADDCARLGGRSHARLGLQFLWS